MRMAIQTAFDLIPSSTCQASNVRSLVPERVWVRIRRQVRDEAGGRCERCGRVGRRVPGVRSPGLLEAHELWSYDDVEHVQSLIKIECLCPDCHQAMHWVFNWAPTNGSEFHLGPRLAMIEMIEKIGLTEGDLGQHHAEVWRIYEERSEHDWQLELSAAQHYGVTLDPLTADERHEPHPESRPAKTLSQLADKGKTPRPVGTPRTTMKRST